uniref:Beta sliding clamp n=1 Tax=uncultured Bacillota bacterium TaxID=344338 RepID=A0A650F4Y6_9FIRM|nr:DNA polymerase III subunit beta [uncultured Firmicutes bacterium]
MEIICNREMLTDAINIVSKAVSTRSALNVLEGICIRAEDDKKVVLTGNDLDVAIEAVIDAEVKEAGAIVLNAKMLLSIMRTLTEEKVYITVNEKNMTLIKNGNAKFEINGIKAEEFPEFPVVDPEYSIEVEREKFKEMVEKTIFSVSFSDNKPVLTGCYLEGTEDGLRMVAVDGYRVAIRNVKTETKFERNGVIIPSKSLNEMTKILKDSDEPLVINCTSKNAMFLFDNYRMSTRLIEGEYINYKSIIPQNFELIVECPTAALMDSVSRASLIITNDMNKSPVKFNIEDENIKVSCETMAGSVDDNIPVSMPEKSLEIGFNHVYLLDALRACDSENVMLKFNTNTTPMIITGTENDETFLYLILPMRMKAE